jgi:hypothetical protein
MSQTNKCTLIKYILSYITTHRQVSVASVTIIIVSHTNTNNVQLFNETRN